MNLNIITNEKAGCFWALPNVLSISRIIVVPFIYWGFARDSYVGVSILIGWAFLTDAADGYLARRFNWKSKWGLILDPLADKILIGSVTIFLVLFREFPLWAAVLIIVRDVSILGAGVYLYINPGATIIPADRIGKVTTLLMGGAIFLYAVDYKPYAEWLLWLALCCVIVSGISYTVRFGQSTRSTVNEKISDGPEVIHESSRGSKTS